MDRQKPKLTDKQRLEFAKSVETFLEASHANWRRVLTFSFIKGVVTGLGVFVGGSIVVALLLWILSGLGQVPFVNNLTNSVQRTIDQGKN